MNKIFSAKVVSRISEIIHLMKPLKAVIKQWRIWNGKLHSSELTDKW